MSGYAYATEHIQWQIDEGWDGRIYLVRFVPSDDNPPFGGRYVNHSDHDNTLEAERAADSIEWAEHPVEEVALPPIPLVGRVAA